ncbi:sensor domain-containing diguanylate cyclase [Lacrimispora sp.]|uniref:sensor domain-containing diguanylate cyclase n=1 Tax=Lacrimispora sp. TaxID=2719234 RepID=UPI002FDB0BA4
METVARILLTYLSNVVYDPESAVLDLKELPEEFREFGRGLMYFSKCVLETTELADALSKGCLDMKLPPASNELSSPVKNLHAVLKHLTWQTQQVARGDYQQRVDFMGDFSDAFNSMTEQLEQQRFALLREIESRQREIHMLARNKSLYELLVGKIAQWIVVADADTAEWLFISHEMDSTLTGIHSEQRLRQWMKRQAEVMKGKEEPRVTELEFSEEEGGQYYSVSIHPMRWHKRNALTFVISDVTRERERLNNLQNIANYDTLTQAYNRHYCMELLDEWLDEGETFLICFIDIDNLKHVNDQFGHMEGDNYIIRVSDVLREFSPEVITCRIGGDEFVLLIQNWTAKAARERMEALRNCLNAANRKSGLSFEYSISYGVIEVEEDNILSAADLLNAADEKMYEYKRAYKKRLIEKQ